MPLTKQILNTKLTPEIEFQLLADRYLLHEEYFGFISSGVEFASTRFQIDGKLRLDGKLISGDVVINGELKITSGGILEIDNFFVESVV